MAPPPTDYGTCPICETVIVDVDQLRVVLVCGHTFHRPCVWRKLTTPHSPRRCPSCHIMCDVNDVKSIYFNGAFEHVGDGRLRLRDRVVGCIGGTIAIFVRFAMRRAQMMGWNANLSILQTGRAPTNEVEQTRLLLLEKGSRVSELKRELETVRTERSLVCENVRIARREHLDAMHRRRDVRIELDAELAGNREAAEELRKASFHVNRVHFDVLDAEANLRELSEQNAQVFARNSALKRHNCQMVKGLSGRAVTLTDRVMGLSTKEQLPESCEELFRRWK